MSILKTNKIISIIFWNISCENGESLQPSQEENARKRHLSDMSEGGPVGKTAFRDEREMFSASNSTGPGFTWTYIDFCVVSVKNIESLPRENSPSLCIFGGRTARASFQRGGRQRSPPAPGWPFPPPGGHDLPSRGSCGWSLPSEREMD